MTRSRLVVLAVILIFVIAGCAPTPTAVPPALTPPPATETSAPTAVATSPKSVLPTATAPAPTATVAPPTATVAAPTATEVAVATNTVTAPSSQVTVMVAQSAALGSILVDANGMTLYTFGDDKPNVSNCAGACAGIWPPLTVPAGATPSAGPGVVGTLGTIQRADGTTQVTLDEMPLYTFSGDAGPGQTNGQDFRNLWWVAPMDIGEGSPDFTQYGFPTVLATQEILPGTVYTITAGVYTVFVPADAFDIPVTFEVLSGDPTTFKAPAGETPILAFAFLVKNSRMTTMTIGKFNKPVTLQAMSSEIVAGSKYYNVATDGSVAENPTGLQVKAGELTHPVAGAGVGWLITSPAASPTPSTGGLYSTGQVTVMAANNPTLGTILVDANGMTLYTLTRDQANDSTCTGSCAQLWPPLTVPAGTTPTAGPGVVGTLGTFQRADGTTQVSIDTMPLYTYSGDAKAGEANGQNFRGLGIWFVVPMGLGLGAPDFAMYGFETVVAGQDIAPGTPYTITAGVYTVMIPADAFDIPVSFEILSGAPALFKAPAGETPIYAFAFRVKDMRLSNMLVGKFNKPVTLEIKSPEILAGTKYYNVGTDGTLAENSTGLQVMVGDLKHPIAGTGVGWLITVPTGAPTTVMVSRNANLGAILAEAKGFTLYTFGNDKPNESTCYGACAGIWPPLTVPAGTVPTAGPGFEGTLGTAQRTDGTTQVTVDTMPVYTFSGDTKPGDANGQNYKDFGVWWVVPMDIGLGAPDFEKYGFPIVLETQDIVPGKVYTITTDIYTVTVPADAFDIPVTFTLLGGDPTTFKAPAGEAPALAFAFLVQNTRLPSMTIGKFNRPVMLEAKSPEILPTGKYYNVATDGTLTENPTGLQVMQGELTHPIAGAPVGWLITTPSAAKTTVMVANNSTLGSILVDPKGMTLYTFGNDTPNVSNCTGGCASLWPPLTVPAGSTLTAGAGFEGTLGTIQRADGTTQVTLDEMPLYTFSGDASPGQANGQGFLNLWYVAPMDLDLGSPDFSDCGFPTVLATQDILPGTAYTITAGTLEVMVPANAFDLPVTFEVLGGDPTAFKAPTGETPILAFAFKVTSPRLKDMNIGKFYEPVTVGVKSAQIVAGSKYYNVGTDGTLALNATGLQVKAGELTHPVSVAIVGWLITSPS